MVERLARQATHRVDYIKRTRQARRGRFRSQTEFLAALGGGMPQTTWKTYETHVAMPIYLIEQFCAICDVDANWLLTGRGRAPAVLVPPREPRKPRKPRQPAATPLALKTAQK